jgi:hypothetical protein
MCGSSARKFCPEVLPGSSTRKFYPEKLGARFRPIMRAESLPDPNYRCRVALVGLESGSPEVDFHARRRRVDHDWPCTMSRFGQGPCRTRLFEDSSCDAPCTLPWLYSIMLSNGMKPPSEEWTRPMAPAVRVEKNKPVHHPPASRPAPTQPSETRPATFGGLMYSKIP